jgi:hypothetical protein
MSRLRQLTWDGLPLLTKPLTMSLQKGFAEFHHRFFAIWLSRALMVRLQLTFFFMELITIALYQPVGSTFKCVCISIYTTASWLTCCVAV